MKKECVSCYEEFEERPGYPQLNVCQKCEPDPNSMSETRCPNCGWDSQSIICDESAPVKIKNKRPDWEYGYLGGNHWDEEWTCPYCQAVFEFSNSSV